jgi:membrane associated rhomboid family serine protease
VTEVPYDRENFCYRHPDRQSFILCQRCGRTICTACQTQAAVGVHCPECVKEAKQNTPKRPPVSIRAARAWRNDSGRPVVTYSIIAICVVVYALQFLSGGVVTAYLGLRPFLLEVVPWTPVTSIFTHGGIFHLLLNMFSLWVIGRILEPALGRTRFAALYLIAGLGGSALVTWLAYNDLTVGASGSIFGMLAALIIIQRGIGGDVRQLLVILGINLVIGFVISSISWQAHVGGIIAGAAFGLIVMRTRAIKQQRLQAVLLVALAAVLAATIVARVVA